VLALHANEVVSTARLAEELWGERSPATAEKLVQGYAHALRKQLGDALVTQAPGYVLRVDDGELDLVEFERLRAQARDLPVASASEVLTRALSLWHGRRALSDVELEGPSRHEVERLNELHLGTLVERIETDLALGRHADVVGELEALVAAHPLDERLRRQLMLALYSSGRQAEALEAYQRARRLLVEELGIEPSVELQTLEKAILNHDPALAVSPRPAPTSPADVTAPARVPVSTVVSRETRKTVTVFFCDVTGSTALGERVDAEVVRRVMLRYFEVSKVVIERHGGTVEKFAGDAVMALFGVPLLHEDDALRAVRAACELRDALVMLNGELERDYGVRLEYRIGLNTGEVVSGTDERLATGDAVNVAARLEQAAQPGDVLISEETLRLVRDAVEVEHVPPLALKGKRERVLAHRLVAVTEAAPGSTRGLDTSMVGRQEELDQLRRAYERAVRDRACHLFTLLGSAGVGKSRLAAEFVASTEGATVVRGRCLSYGEGITYLPVIEIVRQLLGGEPDARLVELAPDAEIASAIAGLLGDERGLSSAEGTAWAVRRLLEAAAASGPLIVVLDDLQWGEQTFLELVEHVADWSREAPILLLCMARPELLDLRPTWGGGKLNASAVLLEPLSPVETDELIEHRRAGMSVDDRLRARIRDTAEGNPLFVEQMLALVAESPEGALTVPPTIQALLAARLDQLEGAERAVLECGAVEGRVFHRGAVRAMAPEESRVDHLMALVRKELIRPFAAQIHGEDSFRFRHQLIRDAAYDGIPKVKRAELHERFASWLAAHGADLVELDELLGHHLEQAYRYRAELGPIDERARSLAARARERLVVAGRRAFGRGDVPAAAALLQRGAELSTEQLDVPLRLELAEALYENGMTQRAAALIDETVARAAAAGERLGELRARLAAVSIAVRVGSAAKSAEQLDLAREALPLFEEAGDDAGLLDAWNAVADAAHMQCQMADRVHATQRGLEYARRLGSARREGQVLRRLGNALARGPTPVEEALAWFEEHGWLQTSAPVTEGTRGQLLAMLGRFDEGRALIAEGASRAEKFGQPEEVAALVGEFLWQVEMLASDFPAAERNARLGCETLERLGRGAVLSTYSSFLAEALWELGRDEEALTWSRRSEDLGAHDDRLTQVGWRQVRAKVLARTGSHEEALKLACEAVELAETTDMAVLRADAARSLGEVNVLTGHPDAAARAFERALELYSAKGVLPMVDRVRARLGQLAGSASKVP
jgi:class 3 adenylate cyclase